jgi:hypothetical protein
VLAAAAATLLLSGCSSGSHRYVNVPLEEWAIGLSPDVVKAGRVRLSAVNQGTAPTNWYY